MVSVPKEAMVVSAQEQLEPLFAALLSQFEADGATHEQSFFAAQYDVLHRAVEEVQIAELFMQLSTVAFVGFQFTPSQAFLVDALLEKAEQIAHTLSADGGQSH